MCVTLKTCVKQELHTIFELVNPTESFAERDIQSNESYQLYKRLFLLELILTRNRSQGLTRGPVRMHLIKVVNA
jgi:hypothetical protein